MFEDINCVDYWNMVRLGGSIKLYFKTLQLLTTASEIIMLQPGKFIVFNNIMTML